MIKVFLLGCKGCSVFQRFDKIYYKLESHAWPLILIVVIYSSHCFGCGKFIYDEIISL